LELDRQSIEKRDFPIARRGYDPAVVDAHLRALAVEIEELLHELDSRGGESLGSAAGAQVQSILEAAEKTAAEIERQATDEARRTRAEADTAAARTRESAIAQAQAHVQAVSQATAVLLGRVESMDSEVGALVQSLRDGAGRLAADLGSVETNMGELYDAASGRAAGETQAGDEGWAGGEGRAGDEAPPVEVSRTEALAPKANGLAPVQASSPAAAAPAAARADTDKSPAAASTPAAALTPTSAPAARDAAAAGEERAPAPGQEGAGSAGGAAQHAAKAIGDVDGARLIALNMALNGESREQAERYLAENFELPDREKLLDEVYAAIEG
jgi:vacuolar-type H+-ATPase subunit H